MNELQGFARVHAAVEQVDLVAVDEEENVDEAVLEGDRQAELEDPFGYLVQRGRRAQAIPSAISFRRATALNCREACAPVPGGTR